MRILLVGEYSRLHNSLKEGLQELGHDVTLVGNGDEFKKYPVDLNIDARFSKSKFPNMVRQLLYRLFSYDFAKLETAFRFSRLLPKLKNFDFVQLINETPLQTHPVLEYRLLKKLKKQNSNLFILACGADVIYVNALQDRTFRYSMLNPLLDNPGLKSNYKYLLRYLREDLKKHHEKMQSLTNGVIATDLDYAIPMQGQKTYLGMIPNPVNHDKISLVEHYPKNPIVIFLGINLGNYHQKGIPIFESAIAIIEAKFADRVRIIVSKNRPYAEYIRNFDQADIVLDQVFAYDQGYNALEAMAKGKVVFTGAETEFMEHYHLTERVAVNALPDAEAIAKDLEFLINNPQEIVAIGKRARKFVEKEHDYVKVARRYLDFWAEKPLVQEPIKE